ncbi:MAG: cation diffusion facilitator family transporter [Rhodobiaceae bacterium]|nr:cation diffusion facilitator family transporter [Rhodobiaceae bacterium]MCC0057428.1 cation diffusion facilitator family transporter [Rhodobiaceae bacterium]
MTDIHSQKTRAVLLSLAASILLALAKLAAGWWIGSLALVTDALHSMTDFLASFVTLLAVRQAAKPADDIHTYGHGKFENLAALGETALLLLLAGGVSVEAFSRIGSNAHVPVQSLVAYAVLAVEMIVNGWRAWALHRLARQTASAALASNALHFASDVGSSVAVIGGLVAAAYGFADADAIATLVVAAIIAFIALRLGKRTFDQLVDAAPAGLVDRITAHVDSVPGVLRVGAVRMRRVGPDNFVEVGIDVARTLPAERIGRIVDTVRATVQYDLPGAAMQVEPRPVPLDDETILERVHLAAARAHLPVHHVTIQELSGHTAIALDLEVDGRMDLVRAHDEALRLEAALKAELGDDTEIEIHIEPARPEPIGSSTANEEAHARIQADLERHAADIGKISDIHRLRVRTLETGLFIAFHCRLPRDMTISEAHGRLDALERALRVDWPNVRRIVSHADPLPRPGGGSLREDDANG